MAKKCSKLIQLFVCSVRMRVGSKKNDKNFCYLLYFYLACFTKWKPKTLVNHLEKGTSNKIAVNCRDDRNRYKKNIEKEKLNWLILYFINWPAQMMSKGNESIKRMSFSIWKQWKLHKISGGQWNFLFWLLCVTDRKSALSLMEYVQCCCCFQHVRHIMELALEFPVERAT